MHKLILESQLNTQIELQSEVILLQLLSETKLLFYLKNCKESANFYDIQLQKTCKQLEIQYCSDYQFILSQNEKSMGVYDKKKRILRIYDMETNQNRQFKKKFGFVGVLNNQIVGINKLSSAFIIQFDGTFISKELPKYFFKKPYHIELAGNRLFIRKWNQIHVLTLNSTKGYEFKFWIKLVTKDINIQFVKTGHNIYFMLGKSKSFYLFKNCNKFKKVTSHFVAYCEKSQRILSNNSSRVCMRIDGFFECLCYRNLLKKPFYVMRFSDENAKIGLDKFQVVATNQYIFIWHLNIIQIFNI